MTLKQLPNGYLIGDREGKKPPVPEGYERAHDDPYVLLPILPACKGRTVKMSKTRCKKCAPTETIHCSFSNSIVTRLECTNCGGQK